MKRLKFWGALLIFLILLLNPDEAVANAQRAMGIWYSSIVPALFPFLVLMPLLTGKEACRAYEAMFSKWMRPLFRLPGSAAPAMLAAMISGSPGGAITLRRVAKNSELSLSEARRIALALGGVSPAYLIIGVGQALHGSVSVGMKLAGIQLGIQLLMLWIIPDDGRKDRFHPEAEIQEEKNPVAAAVESIIGICGYMVFYSVIAGAASDVLGKVIGEIILPIMELPSGLAALAASDLPYKLFLQGAAIGFTGLCIISQNMYALRELNLKWKHYISARLLSAVLFGTLLAVMASDWKSYAPEFCEVFRKTYAVSLMTAGIIVVPGLFLLSKKLFLNICRSGNKK